MERTLNISRMSVTLDVSKLSGWLNAHVRCRESKGGHMVWCIRRITGGGRRRATAAQAVGRDCGLGAGPGEERTSNMPAMVLTLEVSKLSGWLNALAP